MANLLDERAITRRSGVSYHDAVAGMLFGANAPESNFQHLECTSSRCSFVARNVSVKNSSAQSGRLSIIHPVSDNQFHDDKAISAVHRGRIATIYTTKVLRYRASRSGVRVFS